MGGPPVELVVICLGVGYLYSGNSVNWRDALAVVLGLALAVFGVAFVLHQILAPFFNQQPQNVTCAPTKPKASSAPPQVDWEDVLLTAADGVKLHGWFLRPADEEQRRSNATLLFLHETTETGGTGLRMDHLRLMYNSFGVNILILNYRAHSKTHSAPQEKGLYLDAEAALQHLLARTDIDPTRIVLFGHGTGGGVAIHLASVHDRTGAVSCVIVENAFSSVAATTADDATSPALAGLKPLVLRMRWESAKKLAAVTRPILFLSSAQDESVPASQMATLFASAISSQKEMAVFLPGKGADSFRDGVVRYIARVRNFLNKYSQPGAGGSTRPAAELGLPADAGEPASSSASNLVLNWPDAPSVLPVVSSPPRQLHRDSDAQAHRAELHSVPEEEGEEEEN